MKHRSMPSSNFLRRTFFSLLLLCILFTKSAHAKEIEIIVGYVDFPPWQIVRAEQFVNGIDKIVLEALVNELAEHHNLHLNVTYKRCPLKRCLAAMEAGQMDMKTGLLKRPDRESYLIYIDPPYQTHIRKAFYLKKDNPNDINTYKDLQSLKIGIARGSKNFAQFDQDQNLEKILTNGTRSGLKMVKAGRFDAFLGTELVIDYIRSQSPNYTGLRKATYTFAEENPGYFAISKKSPLALYRNQINQAMKAILERGIIAQAIEQIIPPL